MNKILLLAALLSSASPVASQTPQGRLPDAAVPQAYRIDLEVDPEKDRFSGHVEIAVIVKDARSSLWIHGKDLHVSFVTARVAGKTIQAKYKQVDQLGLARLDFAQTLPAGNATLVFDYDAPFGNGSQGLYHVQVDGKWYAWSQFEPIDARSAYPSFDQPGFKTPFTVSLTTRAGLVAVSNSPETETMSASNGMERHVFAPTKPLPTYLSAFMVGPFATVSTQVAPDAQRLTGLPVRIVATQPNKSNLQFALENTSSIVRHLEEYFGQPFPFPKLDQIASPSMPGAMENAGADTYPEEVLLNDGASIAGLQTFGVTVSHELAHQWFGDLVTPDWWSDIWLNESFANWMGFRIGNEWRPDLKLDGAATSNALAAMDLDALTAGRPVHQQIATSGDITSAFDPITYGKGGQLVTMIAAYMGDDGFRKGVRLHLSRHAYGNATTDQFFQSLSDAAGDPRIAASLRSFVDQPGVPLVRVKRVGNALQLTQAPYTMLGTAPAARSWIIPFCYSISGKRDCILLDKPSMSFPIAAGGTLMPNAGGTGYYRFSLDAGDWQSLIDTAGTQAPGDALAMTDSLWAAFMAGAVSPRLLVEEARAILANPYSSAVTDPGDRFRSLVKRGLIDRTDITAYRRMMYGLYASKLATMGFDPKAGAYIHEASERQKLRGQLVRLVGLDAADPSVRNKLVEAATAWLAGNKPQLDKYEFPNAFAAYVDSGGLLAAQTLFDRGVSGDDPYFRAVIMDAIARSGNVQVARWLLDHLDDNRLRASERTRSVRLLMADAATRDLGYRALLDRFDKLVEGDFGGASALMSAPAGFCSADAAAMIGRDLQPKVDQYKAGSIDLARTIEKVRDCGVLKQTMGSKLREAL